MPTGKVTQRSVNALRPTGKVWFLWDRDLAGFGVKVGPNGDRVYVVQYRAGAGRAGTVRRLSIGKHGSPWTPETARARAKHLLGLVAAGRDPARERGEERRDLTMAAVCDLYLAEGTGAKKASTLATDNGRIERHIKPLLGQRRLRNLTGADIERFVADVAAGKSRADIKTGKRGRAIVRGGKGTATRTLGLLGAILAFAERRGLREGNPARGIKRFKDRRHERFLSAEEMARLGAALSAAEGANPLAVAAIRLLALTGCRRGEILSLRWEHVDFERACLRLPDSKTGAKIVPLGAAALECLSDIPRIDGSPYVLPASRGDRHYVGLPKVWRAVREQAGLADVRLHDLRHSFASVGASGGDSLLIIGALLGHRDAKTSARYAHLSDNPVKAAADRIAGSIAASLQGNGAKVLLLRKGT